MNRNIKRSLLLIISLLLAAAFCFAGCEELEQFLPGLEASPTFHSPASTPGATFELTDGELHAYFIDVGQGDSILLVSPSNKTMLIDAGEKSGFTKISLLMESLGIDSLDAVVATHPHSDHIGGMAYVIENYDIGAFYTSDIDNDTKTYQSMLTELDKKGIEPVYLWGGPDSYIEWDSEVTVNVLSPIEDAVYNNLNDYSVMLRVSYGETSLLLTGDCEAYAEEAALFMLPPELFSATALKVGHHGSSSSSTADFINAVRPEVAVISVGWNNTYGHPHDKTLTTLETAGVRVLRTDEAGTIHMIFDGMSVRY